MQPVNGKIRIESNILREKSLEKQKFNLQMGRLGMKKEVIISNMHHMKINNI